MDDAVIDRGGRGEGEEGRSGETIHPTEKYSKISVLRSGIWISKRINVVSVNNRFSAQCEVIRGGLASRSDGHLRRISPRHITLVKQPNGQLGCGADVFPHDAAMANQQKCRHLKRNDPQSV